MADNISSEIQCENSTSPAVPDAKLTDMIEDRLSYKYPYEHLRMVPAKVTASGFRGHSEGKIGASRPSFMMKEGLSPTERGTALHRFMQFCNLSRAKDDAHSELSRLLAAHHLTERESSAVDLDKVNEFFHSGISELLENAVRIEREWRFTVALDESLLHFFTDSYADGEQVILQGECDLLLIMPDEAIIVDYKTDRVEAADPLIESYSPQLELYASAVRQIISLPVKRCYLYSFALGRLISVEI